MRLGGHGPVSGETGETVAMRIADESLVDGMAGLRWQLRAALAAGARTIVVDVKRVKRMSTSVIAALLGAHRVCRTRGGSVVLRNPNRRTVDLLLRHGLQYVFAIEGANSQMARREYAVPPLRAGRPSANAVKRQRRSTRCEHITGFTG